MVQTRTPIIAGPGPERLPQSAQRVLTGCESSGARIGYVVLTARGHADAAINLDAQQATWLRQADDCFAAILAGSNPVSQSRAGRVYLARAFAVDAIRDQHVNVFVRCLSAIGHAAREICRAIESFLTGRSAP